MPAYEALRDFATGETGQLYKGDLIDLDDKVAENVNTIFESEDGAALKPASKVKAKALEQELHAEPLTP